MTGRRAPTGQTQQAVAVFFDDLARAQKTVTVFDGAGQPVDFADGMSRAVEMLVAQTRRGRKVMFVGNGASAAISSHQAVDYWKTGGMRALAFNDPALLTCISNDFGYPQVFEKPIEMFADDGDVLVAVSSSGRSENIMRAARAARQKGCRIITMSGFDRENPANGSKLANTYEGNLDIIYNVPAAKGLSLRFRNAYVGRGNDDVVMDFRIIVNYELDLL